MIDYLTVDWSYPTSTNAKRFGFPDGCWTVSLCFRKRDRLGRECFKTKAHSGHATREEAEAEVARSFPKTRRLRAPEKYQSPLA